MKKKKTQNNWNIDQSAILSVFMYLYHHCNPNRFPKPLIQRIDGNIPFHQKIFFVCLYYHRSNWLSNILFICKPIGCDPIGAYSLLKKKNISSISDNGFIVIRGLIKWFTKTKKQPHSKTIYKYLQKKKNIETKTYLYKWQMNTNSLIKYSIIFKCYIIKTKQNKQNKNFSIILYVLVYHHKKKEKKNYSGWNVHHLAC